MKYTFLNILFLLSACFVSAQSVDMYQGNKALEAGDLETAEAKYNAALEKDPSLFEGQFNLGNVSYKKGDYETAASQFQQSAALAKTNVDRAKANHNLGNSFLQSKKYEESIKAYKESLKENPTDDETRYNLAYAQKMLKQQQQQNQDQNKDQDKDQENKDDKKDQDKNQDQDKNEDKKDDKENQDKDSENKDNKDKKDEDKKENQDGKENKQEEGKDQKQPKPINLSPREAEQLLEAAKEQDQKIQMQLHKQDKKANPKTIDKDW